MLRQFVRKEIQDSILNRRFMALAVFAVVLMPLSAVINYEYYEARKEAFDSQYSEYAGQEARSWNLRAYRPPMLLSALARGTEPYMPVYYSFTSEATATKPGNIEAQEFSTLSTFGSFDFLFLIQVVFSLLAVLLSFDMVAGEKERGTLRAVLANSVPRDSILLGKLIGGYLVLWVTLFIGSLLLFLILSVYNPQFFEPDLALRFGFIFAISCVFLACFYTLGLMVSTFCHDSRTSIVALLVVWVFLQLVIPKAGEKIAAVALPLRSQEAVRVEKNAVVKDLTKEMSDRAGVLLMRISGTSTLQGAFEFVREDSPEAVQFRNEYVELASDYTRQQRDRIRGIDLENERQRSAQRRLSRAIALLSPASALTFFVTDAAGTGDLAYEGYRNAVQNHYQIIDRTIFAHERSNQFRVSNEGSSMMGGFGGGNDPPLDELPAFEMSEPTITSVLKANTWSMVSILSHLIIPFLLSYVVFLKYDVR